MARTGRPAACRKPPPQGRNTLERAAADWRASGRNPAWLLEGTRLTEAETVAAKPRFRDRLNPHPRLPARIPRAQNDRIQAEQQRRETELQAAREKQQTTETHAVVLRKRSRILRSVLAVTLVIAAAAVLLYVQANRARREADTARREADTRVREATALRLTSQGESMWYGGCGWTAPR